MAFTLVTLAAVGALLWLHRDRTDRRIAEAEARLLAFARDDLKAAVEWIGRAPVPATLGAAPTFDVYGDAIDEDGGPLLAECDLETDRVPSPTSTWILLGLVLDNPPTRYEIDAWPAADRRAAAEWARAEHARQTGVAFVNPIAKPSRLAGLC